MDTANAFPCTCPASPGLPPHCPVPLVSLQLQAAHLALWTLLGVPLPVLDFTGPVTQQFVSFFVLFAIDTFVPRRVALKTPDELAGGTLDLREEEEYSGWRGCCRPCQVQHAAARGGGFSTAPVAICLLLLALTLMQEGR